MKRVSFLGNSHVGAMKLGVEALGEAGKLGDFDISIFGSRGDKLKYATVEHGVVLPNNEIVEKIFKWTSDGRGEVRLADYDEIFLFMGLPPTCIEGYFARDAVTGFFDLQVMSKQLLSRIFTSFETSWWIKLVRDIAHDSPNLTVNYVGRPFRAEDCPAASRVLARMNQGDQQFIERLERVTAAIDAYCSSVGPANLNFLRPADHLLEERGLFTKGEYSRGSLRLSKKQKAHPKEGFIHMNADYGEAMVMHLLGLETQ